MNTSLLQFRVWDNDEKKFITDFTLDAFGRVILFDEGEKRFVLQMNSSRYIVERNTGYGDKGNKFVFEGDRVKFRFYEGEFFDEIKDWKEGEGVVTYCMRPDFIGFKVVEGNWASMRELRKYVPGGTSFVPFMLEVKAGMYEPCLEVVGNIHEPV